MKSLDATATALLRALAIMGACVLLAWYMAWTKLGEW